jgi:hypothetical protein
MNIADFLRDLNINLDKSYWFSTFKFFLGFYMVIMIVVIFLALYRMYKLGYWTVLMYGQSFPEFPRQGFDKQWVQIASRLESDNPLQWKAAIIESAEMLDTILRTIKYPGETLTERLGGMLPNQLSNLEQAKEAVKIRNKIVQDHEFEISKEDAQKVVDELAESLRFYEAIS